MFSSTNVVETWTEVCPAASELGAETTTRFSFTLASLANASATYSPKSSRPRRVPTKLRSSCTCFAATTGLAYSDISFSSSNSLADPRRVPSANTREYVAVAGLAAFTKRC